MDSLIPAYGLAAQVISVPVRSPINRRCRVAFACQLGAYVRGQQAVSDGNRLRQEGLVTVSARAVTNQQLPVDIEGLRITVVEDFVFRETGKVIRPDQFLALRLRG